jgi:serine/threonine protein kinase
MSAGESPTPAASIPLVNEPPVQEIAAGTLVSGRYRVVDSIGEGAMGAVYRVEDTRTRKPMALKVLHASMSSQREAVARFEREAIAAGKIAHRNVAAATDFGKMPDGSFFILLEFVAGRSLRAELDHGPLQPRRAIRIMQGVVAGVAAAHEKGIVHRDLKPENIMLVDFDGDPDFVKVLDFGIAKVNDVCSAGHGNVAQTLTKAGTVIGTPDYMSPEQALGRAVDARSDLYSLGVVLYELLAGSAPFRGGAATLLRQQVLELPPPLPDEVTLGGDPTLEEMLRKLLAKKPEDRFQTAAELMAVLDAVASTLAAKGVLQDLGLRDRGPGAGRILRRLLRHLPRSSVARLSGLRVAMTLGLLLAAMMAVLVLAFRSASDTSGPAQPPRVEGELPSESPASGATAVSPPERPAPGATTEALPLSPHAAPARKAAAPAPPAPRAPKAPGSRKSGTRAAPVRD